MRSMISSRFFILLIIVMSILNMELSVAGIPDFACLSLSKETVENRYKVTNVRRYGHSNKIRMMPKHNVFEIEDRSGKNKVLVKTRGRYEKICGYKGIEGQCYVMIRVMKSHIILVKTIAGNGLNVQGCSATAKHNKDTVYDERSRCCTLSVTEKK